MSATPISRSRSATPIEPKNMQYATPQNATIPSVTDEPHAPQGTTKTEYVATQSYVSDGKHHTPHTSTYHHSSHTEYMTPTHTSHTHTHHAEYDDHDHDHDHWHFGKYLQEWFTSREAFWTVLILILFIVAVVMLFKNDALETSAKVWALIVEILILILILYAVNLQFPYKQGRLCQRKLHRQ